MDIVEYAGLTREAAALLEERRISPAETKSDIIIRVLSARMPEVAAAKATGNGYLDLGQGVRLRIGETLQLYLTEESKRRRQPDAIAEVHADGLHMNGKRVEPSRGSYLQPAMAAVQKKRNHRNAEGKIISLNAWRQWNAVREGKLIPLTELKDPVLARRRGNGLLRALGE